MKEVLFINNSRCSTCQKTMKILTDHHAKVQVVNYLDGELTREILERVIKAVGVPVRELLREKEPALQELRIDLDNKEEVIKAILRNPVILQRPIVVKGNKGVIARPAENVLELF